MHALTIDRALVRYRVPESRPDSRRRLDRLRAELFEHALEAALEHEGVIAHELLCIRRLSLTIRIPESLADAALLDHWAQALTRSLIEQIQRSDPAEVVRYGSPLAAVLDLARSLARDDRRRAWAWHTLGLTRSVITSSAGGEVLVETLIAHPQRIVAVWAGLARSPELARRMIAKLEASAWTELVEAALRVHGIASVTRQRIRAALVQVAGVSGFEKASGESSPRDGFRGPSSARDSLLRSPIVSLIPELGAHASERAAAWALIWLAVLDASPLAAVHMVSEPTDRDAAANQPGAPESLVVRVARRLGLQPSTRERETLARTVSARELEVRHTAMQTNSSGARTMSSQRNTVDSSGPEPVRANELERTRASEPDRAVATAWRDEPLDVRVRATTEWAGLLFLLAILRREQLWARLAALADREQHDPRGLLHAFARTLLPAATPADDPALLAFVGLPPGSELDVLELAPLDPLFAEPRAVLLAALERCLPARDYRPSRGEPLLAWLLRRHAEVLAEPGWLELRLRLREVDTDIRRAGLDLDPDWLPELGVVVKFVYA